MSELRPGREFGCAVEINCADGATIRFLARHSQFRHVVGIDIAFVDGMSEDVDGVQFLQANVNWRLPLEDASVDVYVAMM